MQSKLAFALAYSYLCHARKRRRKALPPRSGRFCRLVGKVTEIFRHFGQTEGKISVVGSRRAGLRAVVFGSAAPYRAGFSAADTLAPRRNVSRQPLSDESPAETLRTQADSTPAAFRGNDPVPSRRERRAAREEARRRGRFNALLQVRDSIAGAQFDSLVAFKADSLRSADTLRRQSADTAAGPRPAQPFLDDPITGQNTDSLVYDLRSKRSTSTTKATSPTRTATSRPTTCRSTWIPS